MRTALEIYFAISIFLCGYSHGDDAIDNVWQFIAVILVGPPVFGFFEVKDRSIQFFQFLQAKTFLKLIFTKKLDAISEEKLSQLNASAKIHNSTSSAKDRIYRYCMKCINKRNNFKN